MVDIQVGGLRASEEKAVKRKIAAVLMADVAGLSRALAEDAEATQARVAAGHAVVEDIVRRGSGRGLASVGEATLAAFHSAVEAVRAAVEIQETLRARNKALAPDQRLDFKLSITIGEVMEHEDGGGEVAAETLAGAAHLLSLAATGGLCISQSVRESVASKLKLKFQDLTQADSADFDTPSTYRVASERPQPIARRKVEKPKSKAPAHAPLSSRVSAGLTVAGLAAAALVAIFVAIPRDDPQPPAPVAETIPPAVATAATAEETERMPLVTPGPGSGRVEFLPAHTPGKTESKGRAAPDPALVLTAQRMLPQAWRECSGGDARAAIGACKTLIDSGIAKGDELAHVQVLVGRALRDTGDVDGALAMLNAALAVKASAVAYGLRGTVHYQKGALDKAIADYSEAIRLDAGNGEALNNRAWTYYRTGRSEQALADADRAVRLLAKEAYVWDTRAHIHQKLGNRDAAIRDFRAALRIDPASETSKAGLASLGVN